MFTKQEKKSATGPAGGRKSEALASEIAKLESELAELQAKLNAAEAQAVEAAADPAVYDRAAEAVVNLHRQAETLAERLRRLRAAHGEAFAVEQADYIARMEKALAGAKAAHIAAHSEAATASQAEDRRHEAALKDIDASEVKARNAVDHASEELRLARAGLAETDMEQVKQLRAELAETRAKFGEDLDQRCAEAQVHRLVVRQRIAELQGMHRVQGGYAHLLDAAQRELNEAKEANDKLVAKKQTCDTEVCGLMARLDELLAKAKAPAGAGR